MRQSEVFLKVKIKSLMEEARIIRKEERRAKERGRRAGDHRPQAYQLLRELHEHRTGKVRKEARDTHVLYGFLRGRTYQQVEGGASTHPNWDNIEKMGKRFGLGLSKDALLEWRQQG